MSIPAPFRSSHGFTGRLHPNQQVEVIAPQAANLQAIYGIVQKRAYWIKTQQQAFSRFQPKDLPRQYVSGETHRYLGKQYRLKVRQSEVNRVELTAEGYMSVSSYNPDNQALTKKLVDAWFRDQANEVLNDRLAFCIRKFQKPDEFMPSELIIKKLKTRWGFMTPLKK